MEEPADEVATEQAAMVSAYFSPNGAGFLVCEELRCHLRMALRLPDSVSSSGVLREERIRRMRVQRLQAGPTSVDHLSRQVRSCSGQKIKARTWMLSRAAASGALVGSSNAV
jgi:hypothetical protein